MLADRETGEKCGLDFLAEMVNKHSITLDIETPEGQALFRKLAVHADVIVDGHLPGYMDGLGVGYRQISRINPNLVYCWVGVRGSWGPYKDRVSKHGQWELEPFSVITSYSIHYTKLYDLQYRTAGDGAFFGLPPTPPAPRLGNFF